MMRELLIFSLFPNVQNYVVGGKNRWEITRGTLQVIPRSSAQKRSSIVSTYLFPAFLYVGNKKLFFAPLACNDTLLPN